MIEWTLQQLQAQIDARVAQSRVHRVRLPIVELAKRFELTTREVDLLIACLAVELDRRYERVYGFLHDDMSRRLASPGLAIGLYCDTIAEQLSARALLNAQAPLRYYHLVEVADDSGAHAVVVARDASRRANRLVSRRRADHRHAHRSACQLARWRRQRADRERDRRTIARPSIASCTWQARSGRRQSRSSISTAARHSGADALVQRGRRRVGHARADR